MSDAVPKIGRRPVLGYWMGKSLPLELSIVERSDLQQHVRAREWQIEVSYWTRAVRRGGRQTPGESRHRVPRQ